MTAPRNEPPWIAHDGSAVCPVPDGHDCEVEWQSELQYNTAVNRNTWPEDWAWDGIARYRDWKAWEREQEARENLALEVAHAHPQASEPLGEVLAALKVTTEALEHDGDPAFAHIIMINRKVIADHEPAPVDPLTAIVKDCFEYADSDQREGTDWIDDFVKALRARLPAAAVAAIEGGA